eukprot:3573892-Karenia_brevis.AAC.1
MRGTALHRRPEEERWTREDWSNLSGQPWGMRPTVGRTDMEFSLPVEASYLPVTTESQDRPLYGRDVYLKKDDFKQHGYLPGCPGCDSLRLGGPPRN